MTTHRAARGRDPLTGRSVTARTPRVPLTGRLLALRVLILVTASLGINYVVWRWLESINWSAWWIAVPLVLAETYSLVDSLLFGLTMWRLRRRGEAPPPPEGATVDVFVTTYNEPLDLVMATAEAARRIRYPHRTWILDDGARPELRARAEAAGIGWITRSADWAGHSRHAKAGNLNNALMTTDGEYILILDADQVPDPEILDRTLGWFRDPRMALVQTPQVFVNVPGDDPLGSQAPLFYGPIQQGKDGWNAAFFCGSNAVLRREALMQLGITRYVTEVQLAVSRALRTADRVLARARRSLDPAQAGPRAALDRVVAAVARARAELRDGAPLADVTYRFQQQVDAAAREVVAADVDQLQADLAAIAELSSELDGEDGGLAEVDRGALTRLAARDWSPLGAIETVRTLVRAVDVDKDDEAQPVMPMATISVTEDMATCMRLHALGWRTAYHDETLALGLAPEDLGTMLTQRLRWAQGTVQVMLRENPLVQRGLTLAQRLMYWATMWSYLSGFAAVVYFAAPVVYLVLGVLPVTGLTAEFFLRLVPFLLVNQLLFYVVGRGRRTWRGQQYSLALFPVWIRSVTSAVGNVVFGRSLAFAVTPKERQSVDRRPWHLVRPQLAVMALLVVAAVVGTVRMVVGEASVLGTVTNLVWVAFDLAVLSVVVHAVRYRGPEQPAGASA
ncbi:cellulose synthase (UDP-forming) [Geodermatophilus bullaregiensis]|nr:cellulose synthase (UDP-forming) [Geodermatophilus bullaregiensis]